MTIDECLSSDVECQSHVGMVKGDSRQRENGKFTEWSSIFKLAAYTTWVPLSNFRAARQTGTCNHITSSQRLISIAWAQGDPSRPWAPRALAHGSNATAGFHSYLSPRHLVHRSARYTYATTPVVAILRLLGSG